MMYVRGVIVRAGSALASVGVVQFIVCTSSVSSCTNVRVLLVCVKGLIVRAQHSAVPSVGVVQFIVCT